MLVALGGTTAMTQPGFVLSKDVTREARQTLRKRGHWGGGAGEKEGGLSGLGKERRSGE